MRKFRGKSPLLGPVKHVSAFSHLQVCLIRKSRTYTSAREAAVDEEGPATLTAGGAAPGAPQRGSCLCPRGAAPNSSPGPEGHGASGAWPAHTAGGPEPPAGALCIWVSAAGES